MDGYGGGGKAHGQVEKVSRERRERHVEAQRTKGRKEKVGKKAQGKTRKDRTKSCTDSGTGARTGSNSHGFKEQAAKNKANSRQDRAKRQETSSTRSDLLSACCPLLRPQMSPRTQHRRSSHHTHHNDINDVVIGVQLHRGQTDQQDRHQRTTSARRRPKTQTDNSG